MRPDPLDVLQPMTFEDVLALLVGWVGRCLSVAITAAEEPTIMLASMSGRLRSGSELSPDVAEGPLYFHFEDAGTGFILSRENFAGADFSGKGPAILVVRLGPVQFWIEEDEKST